jgi:CDP-6-deoxy-D-xylo-4-hexulose-3-dehydrase
VRDWGRDCWCEPGFDNTCGQRYDWTLGELPHGYDHKYTYTNIGYNLKITDMQAAVGLSQLDKIAGFVQKRRANFDYLSAGLADLQEFLLLPRATEKSEASWFGFPITVKPSGPISRNDLVQKLNALKIDTRLLFGGNLVRQPYMSGRDFRVVGELTGSDAIVEGCFWIGVYPGLTPAHLDYVIDVFHDLFKAA